MYDNIKFINLVKDDINNEKNLESTYDMSSEYIIIRGINCINYIANISGKSEMQAINKLKIKMKEHNIYNYNIERSFESLITSKSKNKMYCIKGDIGLTKEDINLIS